MHHRSTARFGAGEIQRAADLLRDGALVALPTETVYGLAARGLDERCVRAIFAAKGRPADNPVILHVASVADALPLWSRADPRAISLARALADALWPGPLTIVCHKSALVPDVVTAGLDKVAVRAPAHDVFLQVLRLLGEPLAAPSANLSGRPSPTSADDVLASLAGRVDAVVDGGPCLVGIESTVIDVTGERPAILRPGATTLDQLRALLPDVTMGDSGSAASPGLRHRHYRPAIGSVRLAANVEDRWASDDALLVRAATARRLGARRALTEALPDDAAGYGRCLYAALYRVERRAPDRLVVEAVPDDEGWTAVRDRLRRLCEA